MPAKEVQLTERPVGSNPCLDSPHTLPRGSSTRRAPDRLGRATTTSRKRSHISAAVGLIKIFSKSFVFAAQSIRMYSGNVFER